MLLHHTEVYQPILGGVRPTWEYYDTAVPHLYRGYAEFGGVVDSTNAILPGVAQSRHACLFPQNLVLTSSLLDLLLLRSFWKRTNAQHSTTAQELSPHLPAPPAQSLAPTFLQSFRTRISWRTSHALLTVNTRMHVLPNRQA